MNRRLPSRSPARIGLYGLLLWSHACGGHHTRHDADVHESDASSVIVEVTPPDVTDPAVVMVDAGIGGLIDETDPAAMDAGRDAADGSATISEAGLDATLGSSDASLGGDANFGSSDATLGSSDASSPADDASATSDASGNDASLTLPDAGVNAAGAVDLLFLVDNSGSMGEEQRKLSAVLPKLVRGLITGRRDPTSSAGAPDFPPVTSLHLGVVSSDMGINGAPPQKSCGTLSFVPTERETATTQTFLNKPRGDDGVMLTNMAVARDGVWVPAIPGEPPVEMVPADTTCQDPRSAPLDRRFFDRGESYIDYRPNVQTPDAVAHTFGCIAKLGKNGCGLEQQLESVLKALTPPDSTLRFTQASSGQGTPLSASTPAGLNAGFLREGAVLVVVIVSDEEDCSAPDDNNRIFDATNTAVPGEINVRCGLPENQALLHGVERYVDGLRALKPAALQDRIVVTSLVGMPLATDASKRALVGTAALDAVLAQDAMTFRVQRNAAGTADEPVPVCTSPGGDGSAAPGRRFLQVTKRFGDHAIAGSICENEYGSVLSVLLEKVATLLPRP